MSRNLLGWSAMTDSQGAAHTLEGAQKRNGNIALPNIMWSERHSRHQRVTLTNQAYGHHYLWVFLYLVAQKLVSGQIAVTEVELNLRSISIRDPLSHCQPCEELADYRCLRTCRWTALRTSSLKCVSLMTI